MLLSPSSALPKQAVVLPATAPDLCAFTAFDVKSVSVGCDFKFLLFTLLPPSTTVQTWISPISLIIPPLSSPVLLLKFPTDMTACQKKTYLKKIIIKNKQTQHSVAFAVRQLKSRPMSLPISFQKPKPLSHVHIHTRHANSFNTLRRLQVRDTRAEKESCCLGWSRNVFYFLFCNLLSNFIIRNLNSCFARVNLFSPLSMSGIRGKSRWSYEIWIGVTFSPTMHLKASSMCPRTPGPDDTTLCHQLGAIWNRCDCAGPSWEARARLGFVTFQIWWS